MLFPFLYHLHGGRNLDTPQNKVYFRKLVAVAKEKTLPQRRKERKAYPISSFTSFAALR